MSRQEFIFSNDQLPRVSRHLVFLSVLSIIFFLQSIVPGRHIYHTALISLLCFFPVCILSVYTCLYILLPVLVRRKNYLQFLARFLGMAILFLCINYFAAGLFLEMAIHFPGKEKALMGLSFINTTHALIIGGLALGIKFAKNWYLRQKENSLLARRKIVTELQLEKARIYPRFLYQSLDNLRKDISTGSPDASTLLLKISDLLSYILYDNNEKWVPLEREVVMMQNLVDIEKSSRAKNFDIKVHISGDTLHKYIVPMTLFQLLENCFKALHDKKITSPQLELDIKIKMHELYVSLAIQGIRDPAHISHWHFVFQTTSQRLDALYPEGCQLKIKEEKNTFTVLLRVALKHKVQLDDSYFVNSTSRGVYENS
jgi:sensor histidine kinase YesM